MKSLIRALAIVLVLAVAYWAWPGREAPKSKPIQPPQAALEVVDGAPGESSAAADESRAQADSTEDVAESPTPSAAPPEPAPILRLRGAVVRTLDGAGIVGLTLVVPSERGAEHATRSTTSNASGALEIEFVGAEWRSGDVRSVVAIDATTNVRRFEGMLRLDQDFVLAIEELSTLRGDVETLPDLGDAHPMQISIFTPAQPGRRVPRYLGGAELDSRRAFEVRARLPARLDEVLIQIAVEGLNSATYRVGVAELLAPDGAHIVLEFVELALRVVDAAGAPLADAEVRLVSEWAEEGATPSVADTDRDGLVLFRAPRGPFELCVGKEGFSSHLEALELDGSALEHKVVLEELDATMEVFGVVLLDTNEPVAEAFVALAPISRFPELVTPGIVGVRSAANGEFRLSAASNAALEITAFHRDWGLSEPQPVRADGRKLVLWLPRTGALRVEVATDSIPGPFREGGVEFVLRARRGGEAEVEFASSLPLEIGEAPAGEYDLFAFLPGFDAVVESYARVEPEQLAEVIAPAQPARWIEGQLVDASGAPVRGAVVVALGRWPAEVAAQLCSSETASDGRFRVLCDRAEVELLASDAQGELVRRTARVGEFAQLVLP